ncbi:uncharacterized protein C12orf42 homolog [Echinops telfairi]|uniref:Uncharacterized protein C12orf42 homolog n=1 Tax=Echinops telfairi TaxID=9371 RepID=A0ABM0ZPU9_ECHTE|nr:uncharacterized protein C12orf42 homolog [Echinops telfairi]
MDQKAASPERTQNPLACNTLLSTRRYAFPSSSPIVTTPSEEENDVETSSTLVSETSEDPLSSDIKAKMKERGERAPKQAWSSPFMESQMAKRPTRPHSADLVYLEAAGRHIHTHPRLPERSSSNSEKDSILRARTRRPFTASSLRREDLEALVLRMPSALGSSWEPRPKQRTAIWGGALAKGLPSQAGTQSHGGAVTTAPEMLPKHPRLPGKRGPRADTPLQGGVTGASILQPVPAGTHVSSERLRKVSSAPPARPPGRYHKACSQTPPWPRVNAPLH